MCQIWYDYFKGQYKLWHQHEAMSKTMNLQGERQIGIMNVCDTMIHVDKPICQIQFANVKAKKKSYGSNTNMQRQTDRQLDGQTVIPVYFPDLHTQGVKLL